MDSGGHIVTAVIKEKSVRNFKHTFPSSRKAIHGLIKTGAACALLCGGIATAQADTIISQTADPLYPYPVYKSSAQGSRATSWNDGNTAFTNVSISADIHADASAQGTAYLTTNIGPGTTLADQVAATTFVFPSSGSFFTTLFSGLTLNANTTYYLTIASNSPDQGYWYGEDKSTITAAPGVTQGAEYYGGQEAYAPSSAFNQYPLHLRYDVEGTPGGSTVSSVTPEGSSLAMLGLGFLPVVYGLRKKLRKA